MKKSSSFFLFISIILMLGALFTGCGSAGAKAAREFNGEAALSLVEKQLSIGPRTPGSDGHMLVRQLIIETLSDNGWDAETQVDYYQGSPVYNIIGTRPGSQNNKLVIIGAHYDTRIYADRSEDPIEQTKPVPGANDGASGVAVLLELSRVLPEFEYLEVQLVFFDAEDNGYIDGWDWIIGSSFFADQLEDIPDSVVIVDMIGDSSQEIYFERSSDPILRAEIWKIADELGVENFIPEEKHSILDDHTPFLMKGVTAVDIIDFDYPYWHTTEDTLDKVSASSLENVGIVLVEWLARRNKVDQ